MYRCIIIFYVSIDKYGQIFWIKYHQSMQVYQILSLPFVVMKGKTHSSFSGVPAANSQQFGFFRFRIYMDIEDENTALIYWRCSGI